MPLGNRTINRGWSPNHEVPFIYGQASSGWTNDDDPASGVLTSTATGRKAPTQCHYGLASALQFATMFIRC